LEYAHEPPQFRLLKRLLEARLASPCIIVSTSLRRWLALRCRRGGARLANIMISDKPEGARFALIRAAAPVPKGHPETRPGAK
jgi:hypothetical protein